MKWEYITSTWQPEWVPDAKALVVKLWKKYRPSNPTLTQIEEVIQEPTKRLLLLPGSSKNQVGGLIISMNMLDTLESLQFLRTILSRAHALGGSRSASNDYIQICLEWHSIYSQFQLCQLRLNASFLQQISLFQIVVICSMATLQRLLSALSHGGKYRIYSLRVTRSN